MNVATLDLPEAQQSGRGVGMVVGPDGQASFWLPAPTGGYVTLHHSPSVNSPSNTWCMGVYHVPVGGVIPQRRYARTLCYYTVVSGAAKLTLNGETTTLGFGDSLYVERNNAHEFAAVGEDDLALLWQSWYTGPDLFIEECGLPRIAGQGAPNPQDFTAEQARRWSDDRDWWMGPLDSPDALHGIDNRFALKPGEALIVRQEDGSSNWTPGADMQGYITQKISPFNTPQHQFGIHWQYLHTGMQIPPHNHSRNEEMLFVMRGRGYAQFDDGDKVPIQPGSAVWVGRHVRHTLVCDPDSTMDIQFTITPPSLDVFFTDMGRKRQAGEPQADPFPIDEKALPAFIRSWIPPEGQLD